ncbi:MAG: SpoIIE family protein phosphatase, partial [Bacteroidales bacterium]|nr:SpoIIE family protein phosphatase [Bacteroidales bacterium]
ILTTVSEVTSSVLKQDNGENKDGMDMSLCRFDVDADGTMKQIVYSGAKSAILYKAHNSNECAMIPADRISIAGGYRRNSEDRPLFTQKVLNAVPGTVVYMYSDGIIDQNNTARVRFGRKRLIECVNSVSSESPEYQKQRIERTLDKFSESTDQRDDITFLILKIKEKIELPKVD